jgi:DNA invertase Pin-like site-specific DNA recombinase
MKNKVYGYLRGSTGDIDKNNQKDAISKVAKSRNIKIEYIEDTVSSGKPYAKRGISNLIDECNKGDSIIVAEVSRFARNTEEMLMISRICLEQGISLEILNPALKFDDSIATKAVIIVMGLASEIERHFIRTRTRQSLAIRKELIEKQGYFLNKKGEKVYQLGAKKGRFQKLKLEAKAGKVLEYRKLKLSNTAIGKLLGCNRISVERFLTRYPIKGDKYVKNPPNFKS